MTYVKKRHIGESGRLISNIIEIARLKKVFCLQWILKKYFIH